MTAEGDTLSSALDLIRTSSQPDLLPLLRRIADAYGLLHVAYLATNLPQIAQQKPYVSATYPQAWIERYQDQGYVRIDPVLKSGFRSLLPIDWSNLDKASFSTRRLFAESKEFGVGTNGLTIPIRGNFGERAVLSITSELGLRDWAAQVQCLARDFQIIAHNIHHKLLQNNGLILSQSDLSPREVECLQWAARGKTVFETAVILGISERTVRFYLDIARHKLDAANIAHSVARGIGFGIISAG